MPQSKPAMKKTTVVAKASKGKGFSTEEKAAMRQRVKELQQREEGEGALLEAIAAMQGPDRAMAERIHKIVMSAAPTLQPKTWYGMPAYAKDGKLICHFVPTQKFKTRYATLGFEDAAHLDEGGMWPNGYALTQVTAVEEARIRELVKRAVS